MATVKGSAAQCPCISFGFPSRSQNCHCSSCHHIQERKERQDTAPVLLASFIRRSKTPSQNPSDFSLLFGQNWIIWPLLTGKTSIYLMHARMLSHFSSVQFSSVTHLCLTLWPYGLQHTRLPCPSPIPRACSNSCPSSQWWYPTISSSVVPFSSHLQSFPASGSFPESQFFTSGGQSIGASASALVLPVNIQGWLVCSLLSKGLSRVFSSTTAWKHKFFNT